MANKNGLSVDGNGKATKESTTSIQRISNRSTSLKFKTTNREPLLKRSLSLNKEEMVLRPLSQRKLIPQTRLKRSISRRLRYRVLILMVSIVFVFAITTLPFQLHILFSKFDFFENAQSSRQYKLFVVFSIILYYSSAAVNSLIYTILSNQFRECIKRKILHFKTVLSKKSKTNTSI